MVNTELPCQWGGVSSHIWLRKARFSANEIAGGIGMSSSVNSKITPLPNIRVRHGDGCVDGDGARLGGGAGVKLTAQMVEVVPLESVSAEVTARPTTGSSAPACLHVRFSTS